MGPCHARGCTEAGHLSCMLEGQRGGEDSVQGTTTAPNQGELKTAPGTGTCPSGRQGLMSGNPGCGKVPLRVQSG